MGLRLTADLKYVFGRGSIWGQTVGIAKYDPDRELPMPNRKLNSSAVVNIEDLRRLTPRRVPRSVFDYLDGGADAEITLEENCRAFREVTFRPRSGVAVYDCKTAVTVLGHEISFPRHPCIGRAYGYRLDAAGEAGVTRAIKILKDDLDLTLTLLGCSSIDQLDATYLDAAQRQ